MAAEPKEREIDGIKFVVRPLNPVKGVKLLARLNRVAGPALAALGAAKGLDSGAIGSALAALGASLTDEELDGLIKEALGTTHCEPGGVLLDRMDVILLGRPETLMKALAFALEVHLAGFFPAFKGLVDRAKEAASQSMASITLPKRGSPGASSS